jgi:hypothetical protein
MGHSAVGRRGILFGDDGRLSEPLTTLLRSAQSRVSSGAPLDVACEDTRTSLPAEIYSKRHRGPRQIKNRVTLAIRLTDDRAAVM